MSATTVLVAAAVVALLGGVAAWTRSEQGNLRELLEGQAARRGGRVKPGTLLYYPRWTWEHDGVELTTSALLGGNTGNRGSATTFVTFKVPATATGGRVRILRKTRSAQDVVDRVLRTEISTGHPRLDRLYAVRAERPEVAARFFEEPLRGLLLSFDENEVVDLEVMGKHVTVSFDGIVERSETLDRMVEVALQARRLLGPAAPASENLSNPLEAS